MKISAFTDAHEKTGDPANVALHDNGYEPTPLQRRQNVYLDGPFDGMDDILERPPMR